MSTTERKSYSAIDVKVIAQPRRTSAPSMSAFQIPVRGSNSVVIHDQPKASSDRPYLIAIVALLFGVIGVLTFLLFL